MPDPEGAIKAAVANKRLTHLMVCAMPVSESALAAISMHPTLQVLDFLKGATGFTPAGLGQLAKMRKLTTVLFEDFPVDDAMAAELAKLDSLEHLDLRASKLTETGVAALGRLRNVTSLSLPDPPVTPAALAALKRMKALTTLNVSRQTSPESMDKLKAALKGVNVRM
jgi:hypothetical protein